MIIIDIVLWMNVDLMLQITNMLHITINLDFGSLNMVFTTGERPLKRRFMKLQGKFIKIMIIGIKSN